MGFERLGTSLVAKARGHAIEAQLFQNSVAVPLSSSVTQAAGYSVKEVTTALPKYLRAITFGLI